MKTDTTSDNLDLLILNFSSYTIDNSVEIFDFIFKHNYSVKILDLSNALIDVDRIIKMTKKINPKALCFNLSDRSMYALSVTVPVSNHISTKIGSIVTIVIGVNPADLRNVRMKNARFDFLCIKNKSLLNILNLIGNKDVFTQFEDIWFMEGGGFRIV